MLALQFLKYAECIYQIATPCPLKFSPRRLFRKHHLMAPDFESHLGACRQAQGIPYGFGDRDPAFCGQSNQFHINILKPKPKALHHCSN